MRARWKVAVSALATAIVTAACGASVTYPEGVITATPDTPKLSLHGAGGTPHIRGFVDISRTGNPTFFQIHIDLRIQEGSVFVPVLYGGEPVYNSNIVPPNDEVYHVWTPCLRSGTYQVYVKIIVAGSDGKRHRSSAVSMSADIHCPWHG